VCAFLFLLAGLFVFLSLASYYSFDPSFNTVSSEVKPVNLIGRVGSYASDLLLQTLGWAAYTIPMLLFALGMKWIWSSEIHAPWIRVAGAGLWVCSTCTALGMTGWRPIGGAIPAGGLFGLVLADFLIGSMNMTGGLIFTVACWVVSLYLVSTFEVAYLKRWFSGPIAFFRGLSGRIAAWKEQRALKAKGKAEQRALRRAMKAQKEAPRVAQPVMEHVPEALEPVMVHDAEILEPIKPAKKRKESAPAVEDIPIRPLVEPEPQNDAPPWEEAKKVAPIREEIEPVRRTRTMFKLPPTELLHEVPGRSAYDSQELKDTAVRIKEKFEEFNVLGQVMQINPGPVVTTFEFKPEAGVKYSRMTTLTEDLCLGLQAESILIERIPGKSTVGIEVPNTKREVISLRQILESEEFDSSASPLTVALGKDINGRIKVGALDTMPHLLVAGSTGSGKSVMLNSLIMSILYKATPHQVRMIMVDPKRLEFGLYEGIPHLLTPVITDAKKATNALRNAVLEMERRLKLLASLGVRNIDQYNKKVRQLGSKPRSLFDQETEEEPLEEIPYILILIDELADLMMLERANVEESVTRLAQMARAVGMHLVLATQRPSVDVITGLIKANFPSRISFRVATRVDSRTVLDVMGAEHLLGKGDMLFLPPGSSRLVRVHGSYVSEGETNDVVEFWKNQAQPEYDQSFLIAPISEDEEDAEAEEFDGTEDPMYQEAVRVVCDMGKASTSTLQRRLRLGYGRAARILDMMQRDGIIGPPDGSRPREVLKRPDWLAEVENQLR
jgi:S-DNA-T family DNA segregation ATPase FtsK/SpoIIIE